MNGSLASAVDGNLLTGIAGVLAVLLVVALRRYPTAGFCLWAVTLCFVPIWVGAGSSVFFPGLVLLSALAVVAWAGKPTGNLSVVDVVVLVIAILYWVAFLLGMERISDGFTLFAYWILAYTMGRLAPARVSVPMLYKIIAIVFAAVAVLAVVEFFIGENFFVKLFSSSNTQFRAWSAVQHRGGLLRAEGAFGHSIALGACLALALPMAMAAKLPIWMRMVVVAAILGAVTVTFSRTGIIVACLSLVLTLVCLPAGLTFRNRVAFLALLVGAAVVAFPVLTETFLKAGEEASGSAEYRADLFDLVPHMRFMGVADVFQVLPDGAAYFGQFRSIDSALILFGLSYGLIPLVAIGGLLVAAAALTLRRKATPPTIALIAQLPSLATVALITQYSFFLWFICGLAVSTQMIHQQQQKSSIPELRTPALGPIDLNRPKQGVSSVKL
ncbi:hypothetical protein [Pseudarthrobacter sp. PvP090]|uniref:hypothetical protein n=1 Tax=Pseudarthrobacter sp. PvP090 TaxID=3156393 RepID=UPI0033989870